MLNILKPCNRAKKKCISSSMALLRRCWEDIIAPTDMQSVEEEGEVGMRNPNWEMERHSAEEQLILIDRCPVVLWIWDIQIGFNLQFVHVTLFLFFVFFLVHGKLY